MSAFLSIRNLCSASLLALSAAALPPAPAAAHGPAGARAFHRLAAPVQGRVTDEKGSPLPGATVIVKGVTGLGASADANGNFSLTVPTGTETLVVSSVGYVAQEVKLDGRTTIAVQLVVDNQALNEVVVVGYGTQRRSDITGAVGSVKASEITERPVVNVVQGLQGKVAGVDVALNSGQPGSAPVVRVRGYSSILAGNDPLYVVDGVFWTSGISTLNPADIESLEVLKDASATAIYGAQGSSGVVLVTTKRGRKGGQVSYDNYVSTSRLVREQSVLNAQQYLATEDLAYQNVQKYDPAGWAAGTYADKDPRATRQLYSTINNPLHQQLFDAQLNPLYDVDWQKEVTQTGIAQSHNLSFSGGADQMTYGLFLNYTNANGIVRNTYEKRYSGRLVIDNQVKKFLKIGATLGYSNIEDRIGNYFTGNNNIPRMMIEMIPIIPIQYPDGTYGKRQDYPNQEGADNPVAIAREDVELTRNQVFSGNVYGDVTFFPGLDFRTVLGANLRSELNPSYASDLIQLRAGPHNVANIGAYDGKALQWQNYLTYNKAFGGVHSLNVVVGADAQRFQSLSDYTETQDLVDNFYGFYNLGAGATPRPPSSNFQAYQNLAFFGRANYGFKDRYLLTATLRRDGSSRFGENSQYGYFPSAAVAWRISQEDFLRDNQTISDLKLRFGFGKTGNSNFGNYAPQSFWAPTSTSLTAPGRRAWAWATWATPTCSGSRLASTTWA